MKRCSCLRRALCLLLPICLLVAGGCHGSVQREAFVVPESFDESQTYEITFWAKNDTNITQTEIYKKAIESFEALYPNIKVTIKLYTDYSKIYNDVITNIATDTTPNVCITYPDHIATYMTGEDVVVPLDDLFADKNYGFGGTELRYDGPKKGEVISQFLEECSIGGTHYAIPFMRSTEACYVNKTYVEALGYELPETLTWDFVWEVSEAALAKNDDGTYVVNGQRTMIPFIYKSTDNMMIQLLRQNDIDYTTAAGEILLFNEETEQILYKIAEHAKTGAFSTFKISSYPANFLNAGQCIFAVDSTAGATWMGTDAPLSDISEDKIVEFETAVYPVPQADPDHPAMISQGPSVCVFNKSDPQEVLASWLFAQYLLTNEVQIAYSETEGYVPVTSKAQNSEEYLDYLRREGEDDDHYTVKIQAARLLMENTDNTFVTSVFNGSASVRDAAGQLIESVTKSERRKETVDAAYIADLYEETISLYRLDSIQISEASSNLGPLPGAAVALLVSLGSVWVLLGVWVLVRKLKKKKL